MRDFELFGSRCRLTDQLSIAHPIAATHHALHEALGLAAEQGDMVSALNDVEQIHGMRKRTPGRNALTLH